MKGKEEIYIDIPGYRGHYQVSNFGMVKSISRKTKHPSSKTGFVLSKEKILKPKTNRYGYLEVCLYKHGKAKTHKIHRLVTMAFCGKSGLEVNHIDGIKTNNKLNNLEYVTHKENMEHATANNLMKRRG